MIANDRRFFGAVALSFLILVFVGFSPTYYLHTFFHEPAPSSFLEFHGAMMSAWIVLLLVQTVLITTGHMTWHRQLGVAGIGLAALIVVIGCVATLGAARREVHAHSAFVPLQLNVLGLELTQLTLFACFIAGAVWFRRRGDIHKRLMLLATLCILPNAIVRLSLRTHYEFLHTNFDILTVWVLFVLGVVALDWRRSRRLHPAFGWGASAAIAALYLAWLGSLTAAWHQFWIRTLA